MRTTVATSWSVPPFPAAIRRVRPCPKPSRISAKPSSFASPNSAKNHPKNWPNQPLTIASHLWYKYFCCNRRKLLGRRRRKGRQRYRGRSGLSSKGRAKGKLRCAQFAFRKGLRNSQVARTRDTRNRAQPLSFHILMNSAFVSSLDSHTSQKLCIYVKTMAFNPFRITYLRMLFLQLLWNHILPKLGGGGRGVTIRPGLSSCLP